MRHHPSILLSHPTGNANVRAAAEALFNSGCLREFHSCICWNPSLPFVHLIPPSVRRQLERRSFVSLPFQFQRGHPWREAGRLISTRFRWQRFLSHESGIFSVDRVLNEFDRSVSEAVLRLPGLTGVYAYEDAALSTFKAASSLGLQCIYELPIGYWKEARKIFLEEAELQPAWASTLTGLLDSSPKLARKDEELYYSDAVIVASNFVRSTLELHNACSSPIFVMPYGAPCPTQARLHTTHNGPLRVLFVGSLGQRKGISYLLDAVSILGSTVSLTLVGRPTSLYCKPLAEALSRHHWIPSISHADVLKEMRNHDVLVFPSLFEGFGLVLTEALSQGLPIISTPNTAAPDLITDGIEGFIVPIRDSAAIVERLQLLSSDPDRLNTMRSSCLHRSSELNWNNYKNLLSKTITNLFTSQCVS